MYMLCVCINRTMNISPVFIPSHFDDDSCLGYIHRIFKYCDEIGLYAYLIFMKFVRYLHFK